MRQGVPMVVAMVAWLWPGGAMAFGPGVHSREAQVVLAELAASDPEYAALAAGPLAREWLTLGAIAPDFMFIADSLGFGHEPGLSRHLMALAADLGAEYRLFALGHACHVASDGASEAFVVPALFSAAPVGPTDLFADEPAYKEAEGLVESLGDLLTGDWHAVVDLVYGLWMAPADRGRFDAVFAWYCEAGSAYLLRPTDCAVARAELGVALGRLEDAFGLFDRAGAHAFVDHLVSQPIPDLLAFALSAASGDTFGGLVGAGLGARLTPWAEADVAYLGSTPFAEPGFWARYETLAGLGPSFALARIADGTSGWPAYDLEGIESGLVTSALQYTVEPGEEEGAARAVAAGLFVDRVIYRGPDGDVVSTVGEASVGRTFTAEVRFYSAWPLSGVVTGRVKQDLPGLFDGADPVVGQASLAIDVDPRHYARRPREELVMPFVAEAGGLGFDVELVVDAGGGERLAVTTSRDRLWSAAGLDQGAARFSELLALSPRSLPVERPVSEVGLALVRVQVGPPSAGSGPPFAGALVRLGGAFGVTSGHGVVAFDPSVGEQALSVAIPGFHPHASSVVVGPVASSRDREHVTEATVMLEPVLVLAAGDGAFSATRSRVAVRAEVGVGRDLVEGFAVRVDGVPSLGQATLPPGGAGEIALTTPVADGTRLTVSGHALYPSGPGRAASTSVVVDGSPPTVGVSVTSRGGCAPAAGPWRPAYEVLVSIGEPHSGPVSLTYGGDGSDAEVALEDGEATIEVEGGDGASVLVLRAVNRAALETKVAVELPVVESPACVEPGPEEVEPDPVEEVAAEVEAEQAAEAGAPGRGGGCRGGDVGGWPWEALAAVGCGVIPGAGRRRRGSGKDAGERGAAA